MMSCILVCTYIIGCLLIRLLFSVFTNVRKIEKADLGIELGHGKKVGGMLLADDFVGVRRVYKSLLV